ncbi:MAG: hypothetical protein ACRD00_05080 [Thermoanaerobaculia bacterium]
MRRVFALLCVAAFAASCGDLGGPKIPSRDGYRAILSFSPDDRYEIFVRGEKRRVEGNIDGSRLVKIARPDLHTLWQFRPSTKKLFETAWGPRDEIVPGYPLEPKFDAVAYADRFGAANAIKQIGDGIHGLHPCDRYMMTLPSSDVVTIYAARDLERLVVRVEHEKKDAKDEMQPFTNTELLDVRPGVRDDLFEKPKSYTAVSSYEALKK